MTFVSDLQKYQNSRRDPNWKPTPPYIDTRPIPRTEEDKIKDEVVKRCLAFIDLEMQVGNWVKQLRDSHPELEADEAKVLQACLTRNSEDELKHDEVLRYLATYYEGAYEDEKAASLRSRWKELKCNPIVAAYMLECGVFFTILPLLINCGDVYASAVGQWISDDERVHVETNLRIMRRLGLKFDQQVLALVYDTVKFIFAPFGEQRAVAEAQRACKRVVTGKDKQMLVESVPVTPAFFEAARSKRQFAYAS